MTSQLGTQLSLQQVAEPPFLRPNDPLVMVQGVGRSFSHGEDGRFTDDGTLYCRFTGQSVAALQITGSTSPLTATSLALPALTVANAAAELNDLAVEAFFLDPGNAPVLAAAANPAAAQSAPVVAAQQTLIWNSADPALDQQTLAEAAGLQEPLRNLGRPLQDRGRILELPISAAEPGPRHRCRRTALGAAVPRLGGHVLSVSSGLAGWTLPPAPSPQTPLDGQTAQWTGTIPTTGVQVEGRTLLTPQAADALVARSSSSNFSNSPSTIQNCSRTPPTSTTPSDIWPLQVSFPRH